MRENEQEILVIHYTAPSFVGGVEAIIGDFFYLATKLGHSPRLMVGKGNLNNLPHINVIKMPLLDASSHSILQANRRLIAGDSSSMVRHICNEIYKGLSKYIHNGDIIHAHNIVTNSFNLPLLIGLHRLITTKKDVRMLAWCHDTAWGHAMTEKHDFTTYPFTLLRTIWPNTHYISLSNKRKKEVQKAMDIPENRISIISPYVDVQRVLGLSDTVMDLIRSNNLLECKLCLIYPCRLTRRKNLEIAFRIVKHIKDMGKSVRLLVTAPPSPHRPHYSMEYRRELIDLLKNLDLQKEVVLINNCMASSNSNTCLSHEDVAGLYRFADLLLFTSDEEGFGLPVIEALLADMPILASNESITGFRNFGRVEPFTRGAPLNILAKKALSLAKCRMDRRRVYLRYCRGADFWRKLAHISRLISNDHITQDRRP